MKPLSISFEVPACWVGSTIEEVPAHVAAKTVWVAQCSLRMQTYHCYQKFSMYGCNHAKMPLKATIATERVLAEEVEREEATSILVC